MIRNETIAAALLALALDGSASAATVDVTQKRFNRANTAQALTDSNTFIGGGMILGEDFKTGFSPCTGSNQATCSAGTVTSARLGSFAGLGGAISNGGSQVNP